MLYERSKSPFYGTFIITWLVWNWDFLYYLLTESDYSTADGRISFMQEHYLGWYKTLLGPLWTSGIAYALGMSLTLGFLFLKFWFANVRRKRVERINLMDEEQSRRAWKELAEKEASLESLIVLKNKEVTSAQAELRASNTIAGEKIIELAALQDEHTGLKKKADELTSDLNGVLDALNEQYPEVLNQLADLSIVQKYRSPESFLSVNPNAKKPTYELAGPIDVDRSAKTFETVPSDVLRAEKGSVMVWVKLTPEMTKREAQSFTYALAHASNGGGPISSGPKYGNMWAIGLVTGPKRAWRFVLSNSKGESPKDLEDKRPYKDGWHHFAVTWSKPERSVKFYVDGERKASGNMDIWPEKVEDNLFVGTWPNLDASHFIDTRIASVKLFDQELNAADVQREYTLNKPDAPKGSIEIL